MKHFAFTCAPVADPRAVYIHGPLRVTILKHGVIRIEFEPDGKFEDRPSQHFWNRQQTAPEYQASEQDGDLILETGKMILRLPLEGRFSADRVRIVVKPELDELCALVDSQKGNLGGCLRTLDTVRGRWDYKANEDVSVTPGLMSSEGWTWVDDSASLVFNEVGFLQPRQSAGTDWYVFAYGRDYVGGLRDYYDLAGRIPLLPKWALGIWWSRWEPYKQSDLERIVGEFEAHGVPLSVCVVDMDWHLPGWTGYTWNRDFFPDPCGFFKGLHARGVRACMNLHPAGGVAAKEAAYEAMARHMGIDPASRVTVKFDITDARFIEGYFKYLHHPLEQDGVDFWWMDWQQGTKTTMPGLDPLWYLNHLHAFDLARDGKKRPLAFSRWGGWGSHRYPVGFSGDSSRTWETLEFEIELTAQSANTGFGWWSHDIGGFCDGFPDDELYVRWVQFGVLSPIFRFHNCGDPTLDYRPWSKEEKVREPALAALRLRRALIPYLYTAARGNHLGGPPPCTPMYYAWPYEESACHCPGQYRFGQSLIAAPYCTKADPETGFSRKVVWLPPGEWFDFSDGTWREGARWMSVYGVVGDIPLFVLGGHPVPMETDNQLEWLVFPGEGEAEFYDDDGQSMDYAKGAFGVARCIQRWKSATEFEVRIEKPESEELKDETATLSPQGSSSIPCFRLRLRGFGEAIPQSLRLDSGEAVVFFHEGDDWVSALLSPASEIVATWCFDKPPSKKVPWNAERFWKLMHTFRVNCHVVRQMKESGLDFASDLQHIAPYRLEFTASQMRQLVEEALGCGFDWHKESTGQDFLVWWNHRRLPRFSVRLSGCEWIKYFEIFDAGDTIGQMQIIQHDQAMRGWQCRINYADLALLEAGNDKTGRI